MKKTNRFLIPFLIFGSLVAQTSFGDGGATSGGGDHEISGSKAVSDTVPQAMAELERFVGSNGTSVRGYTTSNPHIREINDTIENRFLAYAVNKNPNRDPHDPIFDSSIVRVQPTCPVSGDEGKSGSAVIGDVGGTICVSSDVMGQLPKDGLKTQLIALLGHEMAHQAGYGENDAREFQAYLIAFFRNNDGKDKLQAGLIKLVNTIGATKNLISARAPREEVCMQVGTISGLVSFLSSQGWVLSSESPDLNNTTDLDRQAARLLSGMNYRELRTFCGAEPIESFYPKLPEPTAEPVCKGDEEGLSATIEDISNIAIDIVALMGQQQVQAPKTHPAVSAKCRAVSGSYARNVEAVFSGAQETRNSSASAAR